MCTRDFYYVSVTRRDQAHSARCLTSTHTPGIEFRSLLRRGMFIVIAVLGVRFYHSCGTMCNRSVDVRRRRIYAEWGVRLTRVSLSAFLWHGFVKYKLLLRFSVDKDPLFYLKAQSTSWNLKNHQIFTSKQHRIRLRESFVRFILNERHNMVHNRWVKCLWQKKRMVW